MFKMFAIICVATVLECQIMYENPIRVFDTNAECETAALIKMQETLIILSGTDYKNLEVGCEKIED